jgi:hypothetical protein
MTRIASQDEAQRHLSPYFADITAVIRAGWRGWVDLPSENSVDLGPRTRASVVHDNMTRECRARFEGREGVVVSEKRKFIEVNIDNVFILRFKKLNGRKLRSAGVTTRQRRDFLFQQLTLPGLPNPTVVIAGYRLDSLGQVIDGIFITCPHGIRHNAWTIELDDGAATDSTVTALTQPSGLFMKVQVRSSTVRNDTLGKQGV